LPPPLLAVGVGKLLINNRDDTLALLFGKVQLLKAVRRGKIVWTEDGDKRVCIDDSLANFFVEVRYAGRDIFPIDPDIPLKRLECLSQSLSKDDILPRV
jgi:hypothetical protein